MNRTRSIIIMVIVFAVFASVFAIMSALNKEPQKSLDFSAGSVSGEVINLHERMLGRGGVLVFIDPEVEGSGVVLDKLMSVFPADRIVAVSVSTLSDADQLALMSDAQKALPQLCFEGSEAVEKYNIGNAPVTYFIDSDGYIDGAFIGNIKQETVEKYGKRLLG